MNASGEQWLTLAEARERLRVSRATLYRLTHDHGLKTVRCGGICRIAESELRRWAERHTATQDNNEGNS